MRDNFYAWFVFLALTSGSLADPQPAAIEIFQLRTECGKMAEAWLAKIKEEKTIGNEVTASGIAPNVTAHYNQTTNRCYPA